MHNNLFIEVRFVVPFSRVPFPLPGALFLALSALTTDSVFNNYNITLTYIKNKLWLAEVNHCYLSEPLSKIIALTNF